MAFWNSLFWRLPITSGQIFWVAPSASYTIEGTAYTASDGNDGKDPRRAKLTLDNAIGACTSGAGDVIVMLPGSHSYATSVAADVAGITITGIPRGSTHNASRMPIGGTKCLSTVTCTIADEIINVTAADVEICHLHFVPTAGGQCVDYSAAATNLHVHDCTIALTTTEGTATMGIEAVGAATDVVIDHCYVLSVGNQGPAIRIAAATLRNKIENCTFELEGSTAWDDVIEVTAAALSSFIRDCDFYSPANVALTDAIDLTGATSDGETFIAGCRFPVGSDEVQHAATSDVQLNNNYIATVAGGTGGTLVAT